LDHPPNLLGGNSTGAGTATLGTNSLGSGAPTTWVTVYVNGTRMAMPAWAY
jgi:hypothetical protein